MSVTTNEPLIRLFAKCLQSPYYAVFNQQQNLMKEERWTQRPQEFYFAAAPCTLPAPVFLLVVTKPKLPSPTFPITGALDSTEIT